MVAKQLGEYELLILNPTNNFVLNLIIPFKLKAHLNEMQIL